MTETICKLQYNLDRISNQCSNKDGEFLFSESERMVRDNLKEFNLTFKQKLAEQDTNQNLGVFVKITQDHLTTLVDRVYKSYNELEISTTRICTSVQGVLTEVAKQILWALEFLELHFSKFFNFSADVPQWIIGARAQEDGIHNLLQLLAKRNIDTELLDIIENFIIPFSGLEFYPRKTWHQYHYFQKLISELERFVQDSPDHDETERLIKLLTGYNFNILIFYEFMLKYAHRLIGIETTLYEREIKLYNLIKFVENIRPETSQGYDNDVPHILESVSASLRRELGMNMQLDELKPLSIDSKQGKNSGFYFEVAATIEEVIFVLKVLMALKFIKTKYNADLYRFVEAHIKTERNKSGTPQYMRNVLAPGWVFNSKLINKVHSSLTSMIQYLINNFG